jgi:hypothetical protein
MKLKLCPFCGGKAKYYNGWGFGDRDKAKEKDGRDPSVSCEDCGIGISQGWYGHGISDEDAIEDTIKAWNRRAVDE